MNILFTRLPVFDIDKNTVGYKLLYRSADAEKRGTDMEYAGDEGLFRQNFTHLFKEKLAFICFTKQLILKNVPWRLPANAMYIEVTAEMLADREVLEKCFQLKRNGYKIVLGDFLFEKRYADLFRFANVVKFDIHANREQVLETIAHCRDADKDVLAFNVNDNEDFECARDLGCTFVQGAFYASPVMEIKQSGGPMIKTFLQILAMVYSPDPDIEQIAALISTDPVLTIRLLRQINTLLEGKYSTVSTVLQALVMLGLDKIKQWVYLVGLQRLNRDAPTELLKTALFRASFCERICRITPEYGGRAKEMYLMGLISIITGTGGDNLERAFADLPIAQEIRDGLIGKEGPFGDIYNLVYSYERGDWETVDAYAQKCAIDLVALADQYIISAKFVNSFSRLT